MLDPKLERILNQLLETARANRYEFVSLEHVLLAMISKDEETKEILEAAGADLTLLKSKLEDFLKSHCPQVTPEVAAADPEWRPELTMAFHRLLQRAAIQVQSAGKKMVKSGNLLVALFHETDSYARFFLEEQGVSQFDLIEYISHGGQADPGVASTEVAADGLPKEKNSGGASALATYCVNLNDKARRGQDRSVDRAPRGARAHDAGPVSSHQKQPAVDRRKRGRQNRPGGRPGAQDHPRPSAAEVARPRDLLARHGHVARGHQVPRGFRRTSEGGGQRDQIASGRGALHRRDPHLGGGRRNVGRRDGRVQSAQARVDRRVAQLRGIDHLQGVPLAFRKRPGVGAAVSEDRRGRADGRAGHRDFARAQNPLRRVSPRDLLGRGAALGRRTFGQAHPGAALARQSHRRVGRGRLARAHLCHLARRDPPDHRGHGGHRRAHGGHPDQVGQFVRPPRS